MYIKIIKGNYGFPNGASVKLKTPKDKPFEVDDEEALRLEKLGIAEIVKKFSDKLPEVVDDNSESGDTSEGDGDSEVGDTPEGDGDSEDDTSEGEEEDSDIPKYSAKNTIAELQAIAEEFGIDVPPRASKAQILEILDEFFGAVSSLLSDVPVLTVEDPQ